MEGQWQSYFEGTHSFTFSSLHRLSCFWRKCDGVSAFSANHFHTEGQTKKETKKEARGTVMASFIRVSEACKSLILF